MLPPDKGSQLMTTQTSSQKKRVLSGMRPTGPLHLGHLLGALYNWVRLQDEYECYYMVADWHALMSEYADPAPIKGYVKEMVADWLAVGLDPERSAIFLQSRVPEHSALHLVFSMFTPLPWLERCPTYKEQLQEVKGRDLMTYGFLGYPVLQAADILLYRAECVPVGKDQLPHLELTREIARRFNNFTCPIFPEPRALLAPAPKLLGLDNRKMSKSYDNYIGLSDEAEDVRRKVRSMITDPARVRLKDPGHPEVCTVFSYQRLFNPDLLAGIEEQCRQASIGCTACKDLLSESLVARLQPINRRRRQWLEGDRIEKVLAAGAERARQVARETMREVRGALGW